MKYSKTILISLSLIFMILFSCNESSNSNVVKNISEFNEAAVSLYGVQETDIKNNIFKDSKTINMHLVVGEPIAKVRNSALSNSEKLIATGDQKYSVENQWSLPASFTNDNYMLPADSPLKGKGTDGSDLGIFQN